MRKEEVLLDRVGSFLRAPAPTSMAQARVHAPPPASLRSPFGMGRGRAFTCMSVIAYGCVRCRREGDSPPIHVSFLLFEGVPDPRVKQKRVTGLRVPHEAKAAQESPFKPCSTAHRLFHCTGSAIRWSTVNRRNSVPTSQD